MLVEAFYLPFPIRSRHDELLRLPVRGDLADGMLWLCQHLRLRRMRGQGQRSHKADRKEVIRWACLALNREPFQEPFGPP